MGMGVGLGVEWTDSGAALRRRQRWEGLSYRSGERGSPEGPATGSAVGQSFPFSEPQFSCPEKEGIGLDEEDVLVWGSP